MELREAEGVADLEVVVAAFEVEQVETEEEAVERTCDTPSTPFHRWLCLGGFDVDLSKSLR